MSLNFSFEFTSSTEVFTLEYPGEKGRIFLSDLLSVAEKKVVPRPSVDLDGTTFHENVLRLTNLVGAELPYKISFLIASSGIEFMVFVGKQAPVRLNMVSSGGDNLLKELYEYVRALQALMAHMPYHWFLSPS